MALTPTQKKKVRTSIAVYAAAARNNEPRIEYNQRRPFRLIDLIGTGWHVLDCSGFVVNCFWNAHHDLEVYIPDPSGQRYSGWGNTWTMQWWLQKFGKRVTEANGYLVGDIPMYDGHTTICTKAGTAKSSRWTSHGTQAGPVETTLHYRGDLIGVWRHPSLL